MLISNSFLALAAVAPASITALETTAALDLAVGVHGDGAGPLAVAAAVSRQPTAYAGRDSASSPHKNADLGALTLKQRQAQSNCPASCPPGHFGYCEGASIGSETCGDDCCSGIRACKYFTGCVKGDGSCTGEDACNYMEAELVENSCKGTSACLSGTKFGEILHSCNGAKACYQVFQVTPITHSCNGDMACLQMNYYTGAVASVTKSCNGSRACFRLGYRGNVGPVTKSCNRNNACPEVATEYGDIASITKTCNNDKHKPCAGILSDGTFGHMINRVHAETGEKYTRDSIESISGCMEACTNDDACNGIKWKEHSAKPCRFFGGPISENPCNGRNVCITALQA